MHSSPLCPFSPPARPAVLTSNHTLPHSSPRHSPLCYSLPLWCSPQWTPPQVPGWSNARGGLSWGATTPGSRQTLLIMRACSPTWRTMTCLPGGPWPSSPTRTWPWWSLSCPTNAVTTHLSRNSISSPSNTAAGAQRRATSLTSSKTMWCIVRRKPSRLSDRSREPLTTTPPCPSRSRGLCLPTSKPDSSARLALWPRKRQQIKRIRLRWSRVLKRMTCWFVNSELVLIRANQPIRWLPQCLLPVAKVTCRGGRLSGKPAGWDIRRGSWWRG